MFGIACRNSVCAPKAFVGRVATIRLRSMFRARLIVWPCSIYGRSNFGANHVRLAARGSFPLVPYIAIGPTLVAGAVTLGVMQQIVRAFGRVESSFQYLVNSWTTIVELISVYKRLRAFESCIGSSLEAR
jgi:hypothetical protein